MFSAALDKVRQFTRPVIISTRRFDGSIECGVGAYVILNPEGWIATAQHLFNVEMEKKKQETEITAYWVKYNSIQNDVKLLPKQKLKQQARLSSNPKWITNHSYWWGYDGKGISTWHGVTGSDLAIAQLSPFQPADCKLYPELKNIDVMKAGTSLCRLGYPFHKVSATFDQKVNAFRLESGALPIPEFPNEGIFTRTVVLPKPPGSTVEVMMIETSSPGLRGQSGGPLFDVHGNIWGIQSLTNHLPLGFSPTIKAGGKDFTEHQFLNVGLAVHCGLLMDLLKSKNIAFVQSAN